MIRALRKEPGWRKGLFINAFGAVLSLIVDVIILVTKFTGGAWVVVALVPVMVYGLTRLNKQYEAEAVELAEDAPKAAEAPILRRHVVYVLIETLDVASARADETIQWVVHGESVLPFVIALRCLTPRSLCEARTRFYLY